jgi:hypothetical protein
MNSLKTRYLLATGSLLLMALAPTVSAQKAYALGIGGGAAVPAGKFGDTKATGYSATVSAAVGSGDIPIGLRVDGIYNHFPRKADATSQQTAATTGADIVGGLVDLIYAFPGTTAKAYVIAGAGYYNTKIQGSAAKADNNIGFNGGVGVTFGAGPIAMFFETRYHSISRSAAKGGVVQFVPVTIGFLF